MFDLIFLINNVAVVLRPRISVGVSQKEKHVSFTLKIKWSEKILTWYEGIGSQTMVHVTQLGRPVVEANT